MKNNNLDECEAALSEFLNDSFEFPTLESRFGDDAACAPINIEPGVGEIKDSEALELLKSELDLLGQNWFEQFKICSSVLKLLKEIEQPNADTDLSEAKRLVYSELRFLKWNEQELFAPTNEEEVKWLNKITRKAIGPKPKAVKTTEGRME